jgi:Fic family protein/molecular chaperone DnaK (HSP70)
MNEDIKLSNGVIPTVLSFDTESNNFIIGEQAKKGGVYGVTNIFNFKNRIGNSDSLYSGKVDLWIAPEGKSENIITLNTHDATKKYLDILLKKYQIPDQVYIGIPSTTNTAWADNYKIHIRKVLEELGYPDPKFYYEPFAVFQSFKNNNKSLDFRGKSLLIIDIGGSTFNTCVVRSTAEGKITMGASASGVPLGVHSEQTGGTYVDEKLLTHWAKHSMPKEKPENILSRPNKAAYLYSIEKAKIELSRRYNLKRTTLQEKGTLSVDFDSDSLLSIDFPESIKSLTIDDLNTSVRSVISEKWIPQLHKTIEDAKSALKKSNVDLKEIDYVVLAGGSSQLPRLEEELIKALAHIIPDKKKLFRLEDEGHSVAEGLAITAKEESSKNPKLISSRNARCLTGDLFLGVRLSRAEPYDFPKITSSHNSERGSVISGPQEIIDEELVVDLELPYIPKGRVFFGFFNKKSDSEDNSILNSGRETHNIDPEDRFTKAAKLYIKFPREDYVSTRIELFSKKKNAHVSFQIGDFSIDRSNIKSGSKFIGIDFGNSNSYVVEYVSTASKTSEFSYPEFNISNSIKVSLEKLENSFNDSIASGALTKEKAIDISNKNIMPAIYHSNKIEGNQLTYGQTIQAFNSEDGDLLSKDEIEVKNLAKCYEWVIENHESFYDNPVRYIKFINQMIMENITADNGSYRTIPVGISGADFTPPEHYKIPDFMAMLSDEIKAGHAGRSFLEFACSIHTKFVYIHPFSDGNGRTARILIDTILLNAGCQTLIIKSDERARYLDALLLSNKGDISELISHYADTLNSALSAIDAEYNAQQAKYNHASYDGIYEEIDASENPLFDALRKVASRKNHRMIDLFEGFYAECENLISSLYCITEELRKDEALSGTINLRCENLGQMSNQAFSEIIKGRDNKYFWYHSFVVHQEKGTTLSYLLAFKYDDDGLKIPVSTVRFCVWPPFFNVVFY